MKNVLKATLVFLLMLILTLTSYKVQKRWNSTFALVPESYNAEEQVLSGTLHVKLGWKHWGADSISVDSASFVTNEVELHPVKGNSYTAPVTLRVGETGLYRIHILKEQEVLDVVYEGNGIYDWLPLRRGAWGGEEPVYEAGVLNLHDNMQIETTDSKGVFCSVEEPRFHVYKNGVLIKSWEAVERKDAYRISAESDILLECEAGDLMQVTFTCMDAYGLSYEFTLYDYVIVGEELRENAFDRNPVLN